MNNTIKHIEINIGNACNNKCIFCMNPESKRTGFISFETLKEEIGEYARKDFSSLGFLGGEPTIYPDIIDLIDYAKKNGFKKIHIVSNGRKLSNKEFLKKLVNAGTTRLSVSIHSHIKEVENNLTQVKGGFKEKIAGIRNLIDLRKEGLIKEPVPINVVVNKQNYKNLLDTVKFFYKLGIDEFRLNFIRPEGRAAKNFNELVPRYSDFAEIVETILKFAESKKINVKIGDFPICISNNPKRMLDHSGNLLDYNDSTLSFSDTIPLTRKRWKRVFLWNEERVKRHKIKGKECRICDYSKYCEGPWKNYVKRFGFNELKAIRR